jgi:ankyrin repeat protein
MKRSGLWGAALLVAVWATASPSAAGPDTTLLAAVSKGDVAAVRALVQQGADVNARQPDGTTPLHWATQIDDLAKATLLVKAGAKPNVVNRFGASPLSLAAASGNAEMLTLLLDAGADIAQAEAGLTDGQSLLMLAARTGNVPALTTLVKRGVDVNAVETRTGSSALMWAAVGNRRDAVRYLLEAGAEVDARSKQTSYPHTAAAVTNEKPEPGVSYVGQTVLPKGHWTAVMYAAREGAHDAALALAQGGASLDERDPVGSTALIFAIINGHYDVARMLVEQGANPDVADNTGMTPLYAAVDMHTLASTFGRPDLEPTVVAGAVDAVKMLLAHGANPDAALSNRILKRVHNAGDPRLGAGATPFMRAARAADLTLMKILIDGGANPKAVQKNGTTPIMLAAALGAERGGNNPLRGTEQDAVAAIQMCLDLGVDVNAVTTAGDTAVHSAIGSPVVIQLLASKGAKLDVKNKQSRTPLESAYRTREPHQESIALLRELTGDQTPPPPGPSLRDDDVENN